MILQITRLIMFSSIFGFLARGDDWIPDKDRNCSVYIGMPLTAPTIWQKAKDFDNRRITLQDESKISVHDIVSYLVIYPNGEIRSYQKLFFPLPDGVRNLETLKTEHIYYRFDPGELNSGTNVCRVTNDGFRLDNNQKSIFRTTLTNLSDQPIRILRFAAFVASGDQQYRLNNVSGDFYSRDQFAAWYVAADGWIPAGKSVFDDANYGSGNGVWAYFGITKSGDKFVATRLGLRVPSSLVCHGATVIGRRYIGLTFSED